MDLAEQQRGQSGGAEQERAQHFSRFSGAFERMVSWQVELGDTAEALAAIERGRARSLLDDMNLGGAELQIGRPAAEREQLRKREAELKAKIAELEQAANDTATDDAKRQKLQTQLSDARAQLYDHFRQERSTSPVYRNLLSVSAGPPRLSQIQRRLVGDNGLLLVYLVGEEGSYVLAAGSHQASLTALVADETAAKKLAIEPGPLTSAKLRAVCANERHDGVVERLADSQGAKAATANLAVLWKLLVPEAERKALAEGKVKRLIVVPDGPLALLPFEALVVEPGENPRYLLDVGPPIVYAPSATVLYNLSDRKTPGKAKADRSPVLTVGNPTYRAAKAPQVAANTGGTLGQLAARSRYGSAGGTLAQLPYSGTESTWVAEAYKKQGIESAALIEQTATEANLRTNVTGRRVIHLACHGLADQQYGNFFGALALTPGKQANTDPADDGFLTLPEIYELNLKGCELAILSACETNYGPQQRGEGVWALSRGFLVAGSRRVVASNWLVDDEAAASLVSYFCSGVAKEEKAGTTPDYAQSLHRAKRWVRQQENWSSPYYWGMFVLVGPN
jgi:CHAT domain-containing protein